MATIAEVKAKARELVKKGKFEKAITYYDKIVKVQSQKGNLDIGLYNTIGDIYQNNLSNTDMAVENFRTAMNMYASNHLYPSAIAMAKKIMKIDTSQIELYEKIGEFNKNNGLIGEAINNYILFAEKSIQASDRQSAIRAFKETLDMMPEKVEIKEKLVDLYVQENQLEHAIELLKEIEQQFLKLNELAQATAVRTKIKQLTSKMSPQAQAATAPEPVQAPQPQPQAPADEEISLDDFDMPDLVNDLTKNLDATFSPGNDDLGGISSIPDETMQPAADTGGSMGGSEMSEQAFSYENYVELGKLQEELDLNEALQSYYQGADGYASQDDYINALRVYKRIAELKKDEMKAHRAIVDISLKLNTPQEAINSFAALADILSTSEPSQALKYIDNALMLAPNDINLQSLKTRILSTIQPKQAPPQPQPKPQPQQQPQPQAAPPQQPKPQPKPQPQPEPAQPEVQPFGDDGELTEDFMNQFAQELLKETGGMDILEEKESVTAQDIVNGKNEGGKPKFKVEETEQSSDGMWSLNELLDELKEGVDSAIDDADVSSHYDLGVSFKEMGLFDMAIDEFQKSVKDKAFEMKSLEMLGQCFLEKGELSLAENTLIKAMSIKGKANTDYLGIKYTLGKLYEQKKMFNEALKLFTEIFSIDKNFQDIEKHIALLKDMAAKEKQPEQKAAAPAKDDFIDFSELLGAEELKTIEALPDDAEDLDDIEIDDEEDSPKNDNRVSYM